MMKSQIVQGDVLLDPVASLPAGCVRRADTQDARTLALGEVHGHAHILTGDVNVYDGPDGNVFVEALTDAAIEHLMKATGVWTGEHHPVALEPNRVYRFTQQRQYNPYLRAIEAVRD